MGVSKENGVWQEDKVYLATAKLCNWDSLALHVFISPIPLFWLLHLQCVNFTCISVARWEGRFQELAPERGPGWVGLAQFPWSAGRAFRGPFHYNRIKSSPEEKAYSTPFITLCHLPEWRGHNNLLKVRRQRKNLNTTCCLF